MLKLLAWYPFKKSFLRRRMNCQMSDTIKTLEDQIQFLKKKLEKLDEEKSTALESVKRSNEENRTLQQQLTSLTEQNSRSSVNIRKLDEERDKIIVIIH